MLDATQVEQLTRNWVDTFVVDLNLCPFAKREVVNKRLAFVVSEAQEVEALLLELQQQLERLVKDESIETTLLIHPQVLQDFDQYNQFLDIADALLYELKLDGILQIASFHPDYQFGGTTADDAQNYTNRSPYPMLHLLRESSLERAIELHPDVDGIPERNIELMYQMGSTQLKALFSQLKDDIDK